MRSLSESVIVASIGGLLLFAVAAPATAAETSNSEFVIIREDDVFTDDLYAGAIRVVVDGTLDGDLMAFAAEEIVINGTVTGSVTAATARMTINGDVAGSVRLTGNRLNVNGEIGGDLVAAVTNAELSPESIVTGEVLLWAWDARALGTIGMDLTGTQRTLELAGDVGGDVDVTVTSLTLVDDLVVSGDLGYRSEAMAQGLDQANVGGTVVEKTPLPPNLRVRALGLMGRILVIVILSVVALSAAYGWPNRTTAAIGEAGRSPLRKWLLGALILFSPLIAISATGLILGQAPAAAAFPLLALLVPVILALLGISFALALMAGAPVAGWLGGVLFRRLDLYGAILAGSLIVGAAWCLPAVGWVAPLVVLPWGLGAWIATQKAQSSDRDGSSGGESSSESTISTSIS